MIYTILGSFFLIFKWERADIQPQIRPRKIPEKSCALAHILNHCPKFKIPDKLAKSVIMKNSYFSTKIYDAGTQKNRLNETVLLSTQNMYV